jgi:hypothetical protein
LRRFVSAGAGRLARDAVQPVAPELERLDQLVVRALQLARDVEVVRAVDELLRLHLDAVHVAREVDLAATRILEQLEERGALLLRLRDELFGIADVVLEPLLLL